MLPESHGALSCVLDALLRTRERDDVIRTVASRARRRASCTPSRAASSGRSDLAAA